MMTLAPGNYCNRRSKSLSVETRMKPCAASVFQNPTIANTRQSISKRALRFREQVA